MSQSYVSILSNAESRPEKSFRGTIWITGKKIGWAPAAIKALANSSACAGGRVIRIRLRVRFMQRSLANLPRHVQAPVPPGVRPTREDPYPRRLSGWLVFH